MRRATRSHPAAGFSLIEALVALILTGLALSGVAMITADWLPHWQRGLARVEQSERLALALERITADLAVAEFVPQDRKVKDPVFEGTASSLIFVRTALGPNALPGLEMVSLAPESDREGSALMRRATLFAPQPEGAGRPAFGPPVAVLRAPYRATFSYAGPDGLWREGWSGQPELPRAVRVIIRDARSGRPLNASTAVMLHTELPAECVTDLTRRICGRAPGSAATTEGAGAPGEADAGGAAGGTP